MNYNVLSPISTLTRSANIYVWFQGKGINRRNESEEAQNFYFVIRMLLNFCSTDDITQSIYSHCHIRDYWKTS